MSAASAEDGWPHERGPQANLSSTRAAGGGRCRLHGGFRGSARIVSSYVQCVSGRRSVGVLAHRLRGAFDISCHGSPEYKSRAASKDRTHEGSATP